VFTAFIASPTGSMLRRLFLHAISNIGYRRRPAATGPVGVFRNAHNIKKPGNINL